MGDLTGQTLDRYEIAELIGTGGMAAVYRARQIRLRRDVAIKVMSPALAANAIFRERFEREAQASANLHHPNILTVYDYGEQDGQLYLVVDYVPGGTLRRWLKGAVPWQEAAKIVVQVAEALDYAHNQGVIHRDVKPNNILMTRDGRPLLADFGLVKPIQSERRLTASGVMLGTPDYMAPEQAQGLALDGRADIYALGVMLFEMLTGQHPYTGETPMSVVVKHLTEPMPRPSAINPAVPTALDDIVARATAKMPNERFQRAGEMACALRTVLTSGATLELSTEWGAPSSVSSAPVSLTQALLLRVSSLARARLWAALAAILVAAVAVVLFVSLVLSKDEGGGSLGVVPTARLDETMILVAQFKARADSESFDVSQRIYDKLADDLRQLGEQEVFVYQVPIVIESSEAAMALGQEYGATTVIWGYYDDIGISPNVEAVGTLEESPLSVGLERLNLDAGEAVNFKLYIAKDLPEELSFLTAVSLLQAFVLQGRLDKALVYLPMAERNLPQDPQFRSGGETIYFMQAMAAFLSGDLDGAVAQINQALTLNPDKALFYTSRGIAYAQMRELDQALADFERAINLEPDDVLAYVIKGFTLWQAGDSEAALRVYDQVIGLGSDDLMAYYGRGTIGVERGNLELALSAFDHIEKINPGDTLVPIGRGLLYERRGQSERAVTNYALALERGVDPTASVRLVRFIAGGHIPAYSYLFECTVYQARGEIEQALASCDQALQVDPAYLDALWKRGQLYTAQGNLEAAVTDLTAAIEADPSWPWFYYLRAQALAELGRADEAQADLARALELDPVDELRQQIEHFDVYGK